MATPGETPDSAIVESKSRKVSAVEPISRKISSAEPGSGSASRKVSIVTEPVREGLHCNSHGYDSPRRRMSLVSEHADMGPVRKKSILHNAGEVNHAFTQDESGKHSNGELRHKKQSATESVHSRSRYSDAEDQDERSWYYNFCMKCRSKASRPSWEPTKWHLFCPYPFCPTYRQFARVVALTCIGLICWAVLYAMLGEMVTPGGQLFGLALLTIAAHFGGYLVSLTTLPALIGMLATGILFQNLGWVNLEGGFSEVTAQLRKIALVIILTRAGLDLEPQAVRRLKFTMLKLGIGPWLVEAAVVTLGTHFFLDLPWQWAFLLSSVIAAVSPAVVVPCLFRLRSRGYGVAKGIPTLIIAVSGLDDAVSVAVFGIVKSAMFPSEHSSLAMQILQGPICVVGGIGFGVLWGYLCRFVPEKHDPFVIPMRILMLLGGGLVSVFGSEIVGFEGAGPLGCVAGAFFSLVVWSKQGWEIEDNPAATAFEIFWMIFEPILFGITGAQVKLNELDPQVVTVGLGCLAAGIVLRVLCTILVGIGCRLNLKEKVFVAISWMAKATVQAALGPVVLHQLGAGHPDARKAEVVLMVCVLSIVLTAPTGAVLITLTGPKLLTKTRAPQVTEGWRRSHRPSIRDISIIDEEEEREDVEKHPPPDRLELP